MSERALASVMPEQDTLVLRPTQRSHQLLQRKCACNAAAGSSGQCSACAEKAMSLQRRANGENAQQSGVPDSVSDTLSKPGQPLDHETRGYMESRFGADFNGIRIHHDSSAAQSARDVDAHAYTLGQHIVFNQGQYQPQSESGRHLIAHELAHTLQQQGLQRAGISSLQDQGPEYQRLEREADQVADTVMRGQAVSTSMLSRSGLRLSRKGTKNLQVESSYYSEKNKKDVQMKTNHVVEPEKSMTAKNKDLASFKVDYLVLDGSKGPVIKEWKTKAKSQALRAIITMQDTKAQEAGLWQMRVSSDELRARWVNKRGWKMGDALNASWKQAGEKEGADAEFPRVSGRACEMDHIIELQVGGDNTEENIQVLDRIENGMSGSLIKQQVFGLAQAIATSLKDEGKETPEQIRVVFQDVKMEGDGTCGPCCKTAKKLGKPTKEGKAEKSTDILIDYIIIAGGTTIALRVSGKNKSSKILESDVPSNQAAAEIIPGLLLIELYRGGKGKDKINARIDDRTKTRLPISLPAKGKPVELDVKEGGKIELSAEAKKDAGIAFTYDYLSPGRFTKLEFEAGGLSGEGYITPSKVPFLSRIDVAFSQDYFRIKAPIDKDKLKPPFPGVKITEASVAMELAPKLKPVGTIAFEFGTARKLASSKVEVSADDAGLVLIGKLQVFLPGVDDASGEVKYQGGAWSGGATVSASKLQSRLKYIKSGEVNVSIKSNKLEAGGKVDLNLPGNNEATLELGYRENKWIFSGRGQIKVKSPYLKPIQARILYDGDLFIATGLAGIAFNGLDGTVDATYENRNGDEKVYGKGDIKIDKGRAKGNIIVELHPNQKITGKGKLFYEIKKDLIATAGIAVDEQQKITFEGELSFPDIQLFKRFPESEKKNSIFKASGSIPIPGASIGPIGLKVKLYGGLDYYYYVGPGVLKNVKATAKFNPFETDPDFSFTLRATASIPAGGGITGTVGADVVIDAYIAEVGGGLSVEATAGLEGKAELSSEINYAKDIFNVDASAYIGGRVILSAGLNAHVYAEAGVWKLKVRTDKYWDLAHTNFDTGLSLGVRLPLHYDNQNGFRMPSLSDIKPEPANLDISPSQMLGKIFGDAKSTEKET